MKISQTIMSGLIMFWMGTAPAFAAPDRFCVEPTLMADAQHRREYNDTWAQLVSSEQPDLCAITALIAAQGNAAVEIDQARAAWLWRTDPSRFAWPDDFINVARAETDMAAWLDASTDNAAMQTRMDSLSAQIANHADLDAYISFINIDRQDSPFHALAETLALALDADHAALAACF